MEVRTLAKGTLLQARGSAPKCMYVLRSGALRVLGKPAAELPHQRIVVLGAGRWVACGEGGVRVRASRRFLLLHSSLARTHNTNTPRAPQTKKNARNATHTHAHTT